MKNLVFIGLIPTFFLCQCSSVRSLSEMERLKLDPPLQQILMTNQDNNRVPTSFRSDGTKEYAVIIKSERADDIRETGATISSVFEDVIVVRASIDELRRIVKLPSVRAIQAGSQNTIQHHQKKELQ